jgi:STE24 endopeptidase
MSGFAADEIERARRYHRPRRVALLADLALALATLALLTQVPVRGPWWAAALVAPALAELVLAVVRLPVSWWHFRHDRAWKLSTQSPRDFAGDAARSGALGAALATAGLAPLFALAHWFPHGWVWPAAAGAAGLVLALGFLAPVVLEPVFNRFEPLADPELAARLHALAEHAGTPVRAILVADASRRTTRQNAYVSGIGPTRRVVLWDTLLAAPADEIAVVLAHELGHRLRRHVAVASAAGMLGAVAYVLVIRLLRPVPGPGSTALLLLAGLVLELAALPAAAFLSRHFERVADRCSLELTGDRAAFERLHRRLALANLADLAPPSWLYFWMASHPTPLERLSDT